MADLDVPVHGGGLRRPDQPLQLGAAVVLGVGRQLGDVDVAGEQVEAAHLVGVDGENLHAALLVRQTCRRTGEGTGLRRDTWFVCNERVKERKKPKRTDFHLDLEPSGPHQGVVDQVGSVGHSCTGGEMNDGENDREKQRRLVWIYSTRSSNCK